MSMAEDFLFSKQLSSCHNLLNHFQVSNKTPPGRLGYVGDYTRGL